MAHQFFKVNRLYVKHQPTLLLSNFNIPVNLIQDETSIVTVLNTIVQDYGNELSKVHFAISASYILQNRETGEERLFAGSFHSKGIYQSLVLRFQPMNKVTFVDTVFQNTTLTRVSNKLSMLLPNSVWKFKELLSLIINVQGFTSQQGRAAENVFI